MSFDSLYIIRHEDYFQVLFFDGDYSIFKSFPFDSSLEDIIKELEVLWLYDTKEE